MADSETDLQIDGKSVYSLRVVDLKQELKKRDIPFKGNATKAQLQSLLIEHLNQSVDQSEDKLSEDHSGTTVQSDDTNDTIESNPEANNVQPLEEKPVEQTEPTDLSQDTGITSSVSFGDKQSIKLTIKLQPNDSPNRQMSPKKSPSKELRSPPISEERRKPIEEIQSQPSEAINEEKMIATEKAELNVPETQVSDVSDVKPVEETDVQPVEKESDKQIENIVSLEVEKSVTNIEVQEMIPKTAPEVKDEVEEKIEKTEEQVKCESIQLESMPTDVTETKGESEQQNVIEKVTSVLQEVNKDQAQEITQEIVAEEKQKDKAQSDFGSKSLEDSQTDKTETDKTIKDSDSKQEINESKLEVSSKSKSDIKPELEDSNSKQDSDSKEETNIMINQEIILTEEVTDDLKEQRNESPEKESPPQADIVSNESVEEKVVKPEEKRSSTEKENKQEAEAKLEKARPRRRRWGGSVSSESQQSARKGISSDQLKELIPDLDSTDNSNTTSKVSKSESIVVTSSLSRTQPNEANSEVPLKQDIRVVRKSVSVAEEDQIPVKPTTTPIVRQKSKTIEPEVESKEAEEKREVSPPRQPESNIIFIQNLVRPFTLLQLKEVLGKTGKLIEERFWIDKIKSKCFATYETKEEAVATRLALHGTHWPTNNPKVLSVDFATDEELDLHLKPESAQELNNKKVEANQKFDIVIRTEEQRTVSRDIENKTEGRPIREWDREKLSQKEEERRIAAKKRGESPSNDRENKKRRTGEERVRPADSTSGEQPVAEATKETESPAKLLDDLFKKTNATPSIYWLPLTEEQANVRSAQREEEEKRRAEERAAREEQFLKREESPRRRPFDANSPPFRNERRRPLSPYRRNPGRRGSPHFRRGGPPGRRSPFRRSPPPPPRYSRSRSRSPFPRRKR